MSSIREIFEQNCNKIPEFHCKEGCGKCCGVHLITAFLKEHGRKQQYAKEILDMCPYLDEKKRCTIYEVRPAICRLYGVVQAMQCPYRKAQQYLSDDEVISILRACGVLGTVRLAEEVKHD